MSYSIIHEGAFTHPDKPAIIYNDLPISYVAFCAAIESAAAELDALALTPGQTVAIVIDQLADCWVALLALQALGIDTVSVGSPRVFKALDIETLAAVVTTAADHEGLDAAYFEGPQPVIVLSKADYSAHRALAKESISVGAALGGHIQLTSGTTGTCKKLLLTADLQKERIAERLQYRDRDTRIVCHLLCYGLWTAVGYRSPLTTWQWGGCVIYDDRPDWYKGFLDSDMTEAILTPDSVNQLVNHLDRVHPAKRETPFLLFVSGGFISPTTADKLRANVTPILLNGYASSEINVPILQCMLSNDEDLHWLGPTPLREVSVVDEAGQPCPLGIEGQLRVRLTPMDSQGYIDNDEATKHSFVGNYFYPGDRATQREDGKIRVLGRNLDVLNVRGQKVAIAPIEQAFQAMLGISNVCLLSGINDAGENEVIVALETVDMPAQEKCDAIGLELAKFDNVIFANVAEFPRTETGTGKINRIRLWELIYDARSGRTMGY